MKTNGKKAIIATMAIAMAAGIAGSISGTVAWFQYNTRVTTEFTGTTAKCTEFLQVRTVKQVVAVDGYGTAASKPNDLAVGKTYLASDDHKIYTVTSLDGSSHSVYDSGEDALTGAVYEYSSTKHVWNGTAWEASPTIYGEWKTTLENADILAATGGVSANGLKPVTAPGVASANAGVTEFYGQPVCGYEQYATGTYKWQAAEASDYYGFDLQFRVLDIDGKETDGTPALYAQDLWLTDVTVGQVAADIGTHGDVSSALRVYVSDKTSKYALLAPGTGTEDTITTVTHGALDLGGAVGLDAIRDVPNNYSWTANATDLLDYGKDKATQVAYNMGDKMSNVASNGLYPVNDGLGHLSGGASFGKTTGNDGESAVGDAAHLTLSFVIFLEGWQQLPASHAAAADAAEKFASAAPAALANGKKYINTTDNKIYTSDGSAWGAGVAATADAYYTVGGVDYQFTGGTWKPTTIWSSADYIGAQFNIGLSFGVTTLD